MNAQHTFEPRRRRKWVWLAVLLQCIPLLGAAECMTAAATDQQPGMIGLLMFSLLFWGIGYLYLGRLVRGLVIFLVGPVFAFSTCTASIQGVRFDYEHSYEYRTPAARHAAAVDANRASAQEGLIIAGTVLLLAVDAWRLAAVHNASLQTGERLEPEPGT